MESQEPDHRLIQLAAILNEARDAWVQLGLMLRDLQFEIDSRRRDELNTEVKRYLAGLSDSGRGGLK